MHPDTRIFSFARARLAVAALAALLAAATVVGACGGPAPESASAPPEAGPAPGGEVRVALRAEPDTFNPVFAVRKPSQTVLGRMMADLVHLDRHTQLPEPALAQSWTVSPDGRTFRLELRRGVRFSDGEPFDADDVLFSFAVYLDEDLGSPYRGFLVVDGEPVTVRSLGSHTVEVEIASPYASGVLLFSDLAILPRHRLEPLYRQGRLAEAWGPETPPAEIAGLGPFRLARFEPGQHLVLERNPHYWKTDARGNHLPYLDRLSFLFAADAEAQALRFQAGETDLIDGIDARTFTALERHAGAGGYVLEDLGPGLSYHFLFFNQNPSGEGTVLARKQAWLERPGFRRALSLAVDREAMAKLVFEGRATPIASFVSPGNKHWLNRRLEPPVRSVAEARALLAEAGFSWSEAGTLLDPGGGPVAFSLMVNAGNDAQVGMATVIQSDLAELGIEVSVTTLEFRGLLERVQRSFAYEACLLGLTSELDPNGVLNTWLSDGPTHLWRLGLSAPAASWEAELDRLLRSQMTALDPEERKRLVDEAQRLAAENLPVIFLLSADVLVGAHGALGGFRPAILEHPTLWNADELYWRDSSRRDPSRRGS